MHRIEKTQSAFSIQTLVFIAGLSSSSFFILFLAIGALVGGMVRAGVTGGSMGRATGLAGDRLQPDVMG